MKSFFVKSLNLLLYFFLAIFFTILLLFSLFSLGQLDSFAETSFDKNKLVYKSNQITVLDNQLQTYTSKEIKQKNLNFNEIPQHTIDAFISIEDKNFYSHHGINYKRIIKASLKNLTKLKFVEGASTISQQLIKNTHLTSEKTFRRKFNELILAKELENNLSKEEIITAYLNAIYFGSGAFGINQASNRFFSKNATSLNLCESATLAGIIKSPQTYSPISHPDKCLKRRNVVLKEMLRDNKITKEDYNLNISQPLSLNINKDFLGGNNYYNACIDEACDILKTTEKDLLIKNYKIYTYLDQNLQEKVEKEIKNTNLYAKNDEANASCIVLDNKSGGIIAFSGKSNYDVLKLNRQPGSTFKPLIAYAPALEKNLISPLTPILDEEFEIDNYTPHNYKGVFHGWVSAKNALANSYNIPSVKLLNYVGIDYAKKFVENFNISFDKNDAGYALALGGLTNGIKIKDLTNCYQAFGNFGNYIPSKFIKAITTNSGKILYRNLESSKKVMKDSTSFLLTSMLKESVSNGTCKKLNIDGFDIASKTGTVGDYNNKNHQNSDAWNISYTQDNTVCVWLGSTGETLLDSSVTGANGPTCIAKNIYKCGNLKPSKFIKPNTVEEVEIDAIDYKSNNKITLATWNTPSRFKIKDYFAIDNLPKNISTIFEQIDDFQIDCEKISPNSIKIKFTPQKHLKYTLFCEEEDKIRVIKEIANKQNLIEIIDNNLNPNNFYKYYILASYLNSQKNNFTTKKSNEVTLFLT